MLSKEAPGALLPGAGFIRHCQQLSGRCSTPRPGVWAGGCLQISEHVSMGVRWLHTKNPWLIFLQSPE